MNILGISAGFHDAAAAVINYQGDILFAGHSERYSKVKNDASIHKHLIKDINKFGPVGHVAYYEKPWKKQLRRLYSGEGIDWNKLTLTQILVKEFGYNKLKAVIPKFSCYEHHLSHAAGGFQTSPYDRATVVVIDAIGEWDTISIWAAEYDNQGRARYRKLWNQRYPHSIGLFYSAITKQVGLKPNEDEYILMGMSAYGYPGHTAALQDSLIANEWDASFTTNLHLGLEEELESIDKNDLAASAQRLLELLVYNIMRRARNLNWSTNLVYMGGVALNCLANRNLGEYFENAVG